MFEFINISWLNDFIFCKASIYFHNLYYGNHSDALHDKNQTEGKISHNAIDNKTYSTKKDIIQSLDVFSEKYNLCGKIDIYDNNKKILWERKKRIYKIYDGLIFQTFGQYFSLIEMGYIVNKIYIYDQSKNKKHLVELPLKDNPYLDKFQKLIKQILDFNVNNFIPINKNKCKNCIYSSACYFSLC